MPRSIRDRPLVHRFHETDQLGRIPFETPYVVSCHLRNWHIGVVTMAAPRRVIELSLDDKDVVQLAAIARSRTEPACRVERARILLAYRADPSSYAVGEAIGVTHQTVQRCLDRAVRLGAMAALDDSPRPGKAPAITDDAQAWLVSLACRKAKDLGYPHELWTTRLLARHIREHAAEAGHLCLQSIVQGTQSAKSSLIAR